ncbi:MAG: tetratricopeptide repeat protein [Acidobacteriota bacterium]
MKNIVDGSPRGRRCRKWSRVGLAAAGAVWALGSFMAAPVTAQEALSPLPPPVTRSLYRSNWFEFLSAYSENDAAAASKALDRMIKAARKVGVHRLSDFSRTAVYLGRRAEKLHASDRAGRAYDAALLLDDANPDALAARLSFQVRQGKILEALRSLPDVGTSLLATHESRMAIFSLVCLWASAAAGATLLASILALAVAHAPRAMHDLRESGNRFVGRSAALPFALLILGIPVFVGLGPIWLILYWGALIFPYARTPERRVLALGYVTLALVPPLMAWITQENIQQRSPLLVAAVDLAERREDASAEDGLRQASAVFPEDSDVWFLLGVFAERAGDMERAQTEYNRATEADPSDYRPILNRGNVHFTEGDFGEAIRDYIEASKRSPGAADVYYNLSLARGEAYDFEGQTQAIAKAREISASQVSSWANNPTLSRVVSAGYTIKRARARVERWNAQPKSRRLPGHGTAAGPWSELFPWSLPPLAAWMLGAFLSARRGEHRLATECSRCGRALCNRCRRYGDPALYCMMCARMYLRKENVDLEVQIAETRAMHRRATWRNRWSRIASLLLPGSRAFGEERPFVGAATLFLFFLGLAAAVLDEKWFDPMTLPPTGAIRATVVAGALFALLVWLRAQLAPRRVAVGS